jgi:Zn-dependent membrane protease YugP
MNAFGLWAFFGTMALSLWAVWRVKSAYNKYSQVPNSSGLSGAEVAAQILQRAGIGDVEIVESNNVMTDHYDPLNRRLVLSPGNFEGRSSASLRAVDLENGIRQHGGICQSGCVYLADRRLVYASVGAHADPSVLRLGDHHVVQSDHIAG